MGLSRTVSEINDDFSRKSQIPPVYLTVKGFPLQLGIGDRVKKTRMMGLPGRERSLTISLYVWIQHTNVTDVRTDTRRQQRPRLRIASRDKNSHLYTRWRQNSETTTLLCPALGGIKRRCASDACLSVAYIENIHGAHSYWKQGALGAAGVWRVWAGAGPQRTAYGGGGILWRPRAQLVFLFL